MARYKATLKTMAIKHILALYPYVQEVDVTDV